MSLIEEENLKSGTTLVILVYNEYEAIKKLFPMIPLDQVDEVFVVDGGSTDGTIEFFEEKGIKVVKQKKKGRGNAFIEAIPHIKTENVIYFSGDGNEDPNDIPLIKEYLNQGYDLVIAGRFGMKGAYFDVSDDPLRIRLLGSKIISLILRLLWRTGVHDALNGFRGFKTKSLIKMRLDAPKHEIELQSTIRAARLGMKIKEFPTRELERLGGSRKPSAGTFKIGFNQLKFILRELFIKL